MHSFKRKEQENNLYIQHSKRPSTSIPCHNAFQISDQQQSINEFYVIQIN